MFSNSLRVTARRSWTRTALVRIPSWRASSSFTKRAQFHHQAQLEPSPFSENIPLKPTAPDDKRYILSDLDVISPNTLVTSFLVYKTHSDNDAERIIESVQYGLDQAAEQLPTLKAQIQFESSGKPIKRMTEGLLKLKTRSFELWEHKSYDELAEKAFAPSEFHQPRLISVEAYDKTDTRPVLLAQLSFIPGGVILALGFNHVASDGGARDLALKLICKSSKAYMEKSPAPPTKFDYHRDAFSPRPELLALPKEQLKARIQDYAIFDTAKAAQGPRPSFPASKASIYRIEGAAVTKLKYSCKPTNGAKYLSSYDCLAGLLWKSVMGVRSELKPHLKDGESRILCPVDLRGRGVSKNYFGNAVTVASAEPLQMVELLGRDGLSLAASSIRRSVENTSIASLANAVALGTKMGPTEKLHFMPRHGLLEGDFMLSNWHFMDTTNYDFGLGPPTAMRMPAMPAPGFAFIFPDCKRQSNSRVYDVYLTLPEAEQDLLSKDAEFGAWFRALT